MTDFEKIKHEGPDKDVSFDFIMIVGAIATAALFLFGLLWTYQGDSFLYGIK